MAGLGQIDEAVAANTRAATLDPKKAGMQINLGALSYISGNVKESEAAFLRAVASQRKCRRPGRPRELLCDRRAVARRGAHRPQGGEVRPLARGRQPIAGVDLSRVGRSAAAEPLLQKAAAVAKTCRETGPRGLLHERSGPTKRWLCSEGSQGAARLRLRHSTDRHHRADGRPRCGRDGHTRRGAEGRAEGRRSARPQVAHRLADRDVAGARAFAEAAVAANQLEPRVVRVAMVDLATGQTDWPEVVLGVLQLDPNAAEAAVELAKMHLARKEIDSAVQFANQAVKAAPRYFDARLIRLRTLIVRPPDAAQADAELKTLLTLFPTSSEVQLVRGELATSRGQHATARQAFERAMELNPTDAQALERMVGVEVRAGRTAEARRQVDAALAKTGPSASLLIVAGKAYSADGDNAAAERQFRRAIELDPTKLEAYAALAGLYIASGRQPEAQREYMELAKRNPRNAPPTMVGMLYEAQRNIASAAEWYKKALKIDPRAATAANNLAWIYAERGENLDEACCSPKRRMPPAEAAGSRRHAGLGLLQKESAGDGDRRIERAVQGRSGQSALSVPSGAGARQNRTGSKSPGIAGIRIRLNPNFQERRRPSVFSQSWRTD